MNRLDRWLPAAMLAVLGLAFARVPHTQTSPIGNAGIPPAQSALLARLLEENRYVLTMKDGVLSGPGAEFLLKAAAQTQFFAIGEEHNVAEIPQFTTALFRALHERHGYNYLALEQDPVTCRSISQRPARGSLDAVSEWARRYPNGFTFHTDQELEMIATAGRISTARFDPVWGLDQVFGVLHVLEMLLPAAPSEEARESTRKLIEQARKDDSVRFTGGHHYMADGEKPPGFFELERIYHPAKNSEAEFEIRQLLLSNEIYSLYHAGVAGKIPGFFENGIVRENNMRMLFSANYRKAQASAESLPKVVLKFGHWHLYRGFFKADVPTLGNFVSELATSNGLNSFQLYTMVQNPPGGFRAVGGISWVKPLADAAARNEWTVVDLRPLRSYVHAGKITVEPELRQVLFGFDAAILLGGAKAGTTTLSETRK